MLTRLAIMCGVFAFSAGAAAAQVRPAVVRAQFSECRGATVAATVSKPVYRKRDQLTGIELSCYYALSKASREALTVAIGVARKGRATAPQIAVPSLLRLHCAAAYANATLYNFESGTGGIAPIDAQRVSKITMLKQWIANALTRPRTGVGIGNAARETARLVRELQRPLAELRCRA